MGEAQLTTDLGKSGVRRTKKQLKKNHNLAAFLRLETVSKETV